MDFLVRDAAGNFLFGGKPVSDVAAVVERTTGTEATVVNTISYQFKLGNQVTKIHVAQAQPEKLPNTPTIPVITFDPASTLATPAPTATSTLAPGPTVGVPASSTAVLSTAATENSPSSRTNTGSASSSVAATSTAATKAASTSRASEFVVRTPVAGLYSCKHDPQGGHNSTCRTTSHPSNTGLVSAIGVLAALFAVTLGALLFLIYRKKKRSKHSKPFLAPSNSDSIAFSAGEKSRIALLERQLAEAQTSLLSAASPARRPHALDDRQVAMRFDAISQDLKDWTLTHLKRTPDPSEITTELNRLVPGCEELLSVPRTRALVVRAAAAALLVEAWESGVLIPGGQEVRKVEKEMERTMGEDDFNSWRIPTYSALAKGLTEDANFSAAAKAVAERIEKVLRPFTDPQRTDRESRSALLRIIIPFARLNLELLAQPTKYKFLALHPRFQCETMEDVLQEHETKYSQATRREENELEGMPVRVVVFPGVGKWGNGEFGQAAQWEGRTVVGKARVLV